jgi:hypothetical protein
MHGFGEDEEEKDGPGERFRKLVGFVMEDEERE